MSVYRVELGNPADMTTGSRLAEATVSVMTSDARGYVREVKMPTSPGEVMPPWNEQDERQRAETRGYTAGIVLWCEDMAQRAHSAEVEETDLTKRLAFVADQLHWKKSGCLDSLTFDRLTAEARSIQERLDRLPDPDLLRTIVWHALRGLTLDRTSPHFGDLDCLARRMRVTAP